MKRDPDKILADLKAKDEEVAAAKAAYERVAEERAALMLEAADYSLPRGIIARHLDISPNRVQQVLDRARSQKIDLGEATHRVVVRTQQGDALRVALLPAKELILVGGHGVGTTGPEGPLPPIDTWSICVKAESERGAQAKVEAALSKVDPTPHVVSVEPFDPGASAS